MSFVVTGATGHLGRLVVESLLTRGVAPEQVVATGRDLSRIADLADRGVRTLVADYDDPDSLRTAFDGADRLLLVSASEVGTRVPQHRNAIEAAKAAGVGLVAYTSIANADRTDILLAAEHQATEQLLVESGLPFALLRNNLYLDLYTEQVPTYAEHGAVVGSAGEGRQSAALRADLAEAAAAVLVSDEPAGVYELGTDEAFTFAELATAVAEATGSPVTYQDLPEQAYREMLVGFGVPAPFAEVLADSHRGIAEGRLLTPSGDLSRLLGRPATSMTRAVQEAAARSAALTR